MVVLWKICGGEGPGCGVAGSSNAVIDASDREAFVSGAATTVSVTNPSFSFFTEIAAPSTLRLFPTRPPSASLMSRSPLRRPGAPRSHPPFSLRPSRPKATLPAPTVSLTRAPPPTPARNWWDSLRVREERQDVLPARRLSAR